jgi:hypothetical protein
MEVEEMRVRPVQCLAASLTLVGLSAAGLISPTIRHIIDTAAAWIGPSALAWALVLVIAFALLLAGGAEIGRDVVIRSFVLRQQQALAEARSVSLFSDEALAGVIALGDMGRQVEIERQALLVRSGLMALVALACLGAGALAMALGLRQEGGLPGALIALAVTGAAGAVVLLVARSLRRAALSLTPTEAQVHAALARHQEREEAERRLLRPILTLERSGVGDAPRAPA